MVNASADRGARRARHLGGQGAPRSCVRIASLQEKKRSEAVSQLQDRVESMQSSLNSELQALRSTMSSSGGSSKEVAEAMERQGACFFLLVVIFFEFSCTSLFKAKLPSHSLPPFHPPRVQRLRSGNVRTGRSPAKKKSGRALLLA